MVDIKNGIVGIVWALTERKMKKINFTCRACVEGERLEQEAREEKKKAMDGANKQGGEREEWRREMERKMGEWEKRVQRFDESRKGGKRG